ncbi:hypothetical protein FS373_11400 [Shewanella sp. YLB-07]|nr:hypothetical protein [Shewanella sp. YLB-07]
MRKWLFPFNLMQHRSGNTESLTQCGFQSPLCYVECSRYRITISFKHPPCLQCFELPLNDQIFTRNGISPIISVAVVRGKCGCMDYLLQRGKRCKL